MYSYLRFSSALNIYLIRYKESLLLEGFGVLESLGKITDIAIVSYNQNDLSDDIG